MKKNFLVLGLCLSFICGLSAQNEQTLTDLAKSLGERIEIHGYAQAGYTYRDQPQKTNTFDVKRSLLWGKAKITDKWSFLFMHDFSSVVQEFYTDYAVSSALKVRFGQFKNSYSLENPLSPTRLELIECYSQAALFLSGCGSDPLYGVQYGRDLGLMLYGDIVRDKLFYEAAIMNGQGINRKDKNNQKDMILKLGLRPIQGLSIVATGQLGTGCAVATSMYNPEIEVGQNYTRNRWSAGFEYQSKKFNARSEYLAGKDGNVNLRGLYFTSSVPIVGALEAVASYDYFNYNTSLDMRQTNLVGGLQYWFYKKCRAQLQYTRCAPHWSKDYNLLQAQIQVAF